ncbi:MAG: hypothetical protein MJZ15_10860 [Bacteroidales bacterium]|nr:hypothetical protein [Bacteroidales bacterium]
MKHKRHRSEQTKGTAGNRKAMTILLSAVGVAILALLLLAFVRPQWAYRIPYLGRVLAYVEEYVEGAVVPHSDGLLGIDVSKHQGSIDWKAVELRYNMMDRRLNRDGDVRQKIHFAIVKATEGLTIKDTEYENNRRGITDNGMIFGAFHYFSYTSSPEQQAAYYMKTASLKPGDMRPILDIEENVSIARRLVNGDWTEDMIAEKALEWLRAVEAQMGCRPIIYTSANFKMKYLNDTVFARYPFWIAHYHVSEPRVKGSIWQFTEQGALKGINGNVDVDFFYGSETEFSELLIKE